MSASASDTDSVDELCEAKSGPVVTTSGSIIGSFPLDSLSKESCWCPAVEIGQWRFRLQIRRGTIVPGEEDTWLQCFLYNRSSSEVSVAVAMELLNELERCINRMPPSSSPPTIWRIAAGRGQGYSELIQRSFLIRNADILFPNGRFTIRANVVITHPVTAPLCTYEKNRLRYTHGPHSALSALSKLGDSEAFPSDFCVIALEPALANEMSAEEGAKSDEVRIPVHKLILAARSPVLRAMLSSGMKESCADEMEITGYAVEAVRAFVRFLYTDACGNATLDAHAWELLALADKYDVPALRAVCESYIVSNIRAGNALRSLLGAQSHDAVFLKEKVIDFIVTSERQLLKKPGVHDLLGSELVMEVMAALVDARGVDENSYSPEMEIGQWRFSLRMSSGTSIPGTEDPYVQLLLCNCSFWAVSMTGSIELVDATHKCLRKLCVAATTELLAPGSGWAYKNLMLRSVFTNPANNFVTNDRFFVRVNLVIVLPSAVPLCKAYDDELEYIAGPYSALTDIYVQWSAGAASADFRVIVSQITAVGDHAAVEAEQQQCVRIPAHKFILAARSPVLRAMLSSGMKESCADEMEITGYAVEAVRAFVRFLYTDSCDFFDLNKHSWQLLAMADKYNVPALRCVCETYLASVLDDSNALQTLVDAHSHGAKELKQNAIQYIVTSGKFLLKESGVQQTLGCELTAEVMSALVDAVAAAEGVVIK